MNHTRPSTLAPVSTGDISLHSSDLSMRNLLNLPKPYTHCTRRKYPHHPTTRTTLTYLLTYGLYRGYVIKRAPKYLPHDR